MTYGIEEFTTELRELLKTKFNIKVSAVSQAKNDVISIPQVDANAHYFQSMDLQVVNYNPSIFVGVSAAPAVDSVGAALLVNYQLDIYVLFGDQNHPDLEKLLFRYHESLIKLLTEEWNTYTRKKVNIVSLDPAGFAQLNSTQWVRATGITIGVTLGI